MILKNKTPGIANMIPQPKRKFEFGFFSDWLKFFKVIFINTGQHYDKNLSDNIMRDLSLRKQDLNIGFGSGSHIYQISTIMKKYEKIILTTKMIG